MKTHAYFIAGSNSRIRVTTLEGFVASLTVTCSYYGADVSHRRMGTLGSFESVSAAVCWARRKVLKMAREKVTRYLGMGKGVKVAKNKRKGTGKGVRR